MPDEPPKHVCPKCGRDSGYFEPKMFSVGVFCGYCGTRTQINFLTGVPIPARLAEVLLTDFELAIRSEINNSEAQSYMEFRKELLKRLTQPKEVYIVAIQGANGPEPSSAKMYTDYAQAEDKLAKDRASGINFTKIFTLRENP